MNHPALFLFPAMLGFTAGIVSRRARASGVIALILPVVPGVAFWVPMGHA
jgi:hypothetical protein